MKAVFLDLHVKNEYCGSIGTQDEEVHSCPTWSKEMNVMVNEMPR